MLSYRHALIFRIMWLGQYPALTGVGVGVKNIRQSDLVLNARNPISEDLNFKTCLGGNAPRPTFASQYPKSSSLKSCVCPSCFAVFCLGHLTLQLHLTGVNFN